MTAGRSRGATFRLNAERYALISQAASEGLYDWDVETEELYVSPRLNEMFGFGEGPLDSHIWYARVHPDDRDNYRRALVTHFKGDSRRLEVEYRIEIKGRELRWMRDNGIAKRDAEGLHHQSDGRGHRTRSLDQPRHRRAATSRRAGGGLRARRFHAILPYPSPHR